MSVSERARLPGEDHFRALLTVIADPQKYAARVDELSGLVQKSKDAIESAKGVGAAADQKMAAAQSLMDQATATKKDGEDLKAQYQSRLENLRAGEAKFESERVAKKTELAAREDAVKLREDAIGKKESEVATLKAQAERTLSEAQDLRAKWQAKLDAFESIR